MKRLAKEACPTLPNTMSVIIQTMFLTALVRVKLSSDLNAHHQTNSHLTPLREGSCHIQDFPCQVISRFVRIFSRKINFKLI